jgi:hypothetical protein
MALTVMELVEQLGDYGDQVPVKLVIERNGRSEVYSEFEISDTTEFDDEFSVTLLVAE